MNFFLCFSGGCWELIEDKLENFDEDLEKDEGEEEKEKEKEKEKKEKKKNRKGKEKKGNKEEKEKEKGKEKEEDKGKEKEDSQNDQKNQNEEEKGDDSFLLPFNGNLGAFGLSIFEYFACRTCKHPYFGGKKDCAAGVEQVSILTHYFFQNLFHL